MSYHIVTEQTANLRKRSVVIQDRHLVLKVRGCFMWNLASGFSH